MARIGTQRARQLLYEIARKHNTDPRSVIDGPRESEYVRVKQEFCQAIKNQGISLWVAAEVLKLDHSTVTYHASPEFRARKNQRREKGTADAEA